jgi:2-enoate reductase
MPRPPPVIVATGAYPVEPNIPGIAGSNVLTSRDILEGRAKPKGRVVVAGGGCAGAQTAEYLSEKGHSVTIVELSGDIALEAPVDERILLLERLRKSGVRTLTQTRIKDLALDHVTVEGKKGEKTIPADTVVVCLGSLGEKSLANGLKGRVKKIVVVGDAVKARRVTDAVLEGALAALSLG